MKGEWFWSLRFKQKTELYFQHTNRNSMLAPRSDGPCSHMIQQGGCAIDEHYPRLIQSIPRWSII